MIDTLLNPPIDLPTVTKGRRLVQVILAILKTEPEGITGIGLHESDYRILLDMLGHPCSTIFVTMNKVRIFSDTITQDMLHIRSSKGKSKVFIEDVWVILHPEEETRLHRILREEVI